MLQVEVVVVAVVYQVGSWPCAPKLFRFLFLSSFEIESCTHPDLTALDTLDPFLPSSPLAARLSDRRLFRGPLANVSGPSGVCSLFRIHNSSFIVSSCILPHVVCRSSSPSTRTTVRTRVQEGYVSDSELRVLGCSLTLSLTHSPTHSLFSTAGGGPNQHVSSLAWDWHDGPRPRRWPSGRLCFISRGAHIATWSTLFTFLPRTLLQYHQAARFLLSSVFPNGLAWFLFPLSFSPFVSSPIFIRLIRVRTSFSPTPQTPYHLLTSKTKSEFSRRRRGTTYTITILSGSILALIRAYYTIAVCC
ncbi:hypothetical protein F5Y14DRAFT_43430 [Nemania sp. NC0429]|nr:hypothetical protein F5Y14DRAFT_43430 [Nemania sp. NC0429]